MLKWILFKTKRIRYWWDEITFPQRMQHQLETLKDIYKGSPLLIIGNGPSLNKTPLDKFNGIPSIGMNKINLIFDRTEWRPDLILCTNNLVAKQNQEYFSNTNIPIYLSWKCRFFIKNSTKRQVNFFLSKNTTNFNGNIAKYIGTAGTVTYSALQFAYYTGANPVIIFGVDHNFTVSESSKAHDIEKMASEDNNHFHKDYFSKGQYWGIPNLERSETGYKLAKVAFEQDKRQIYDSTIGGKLKIFKKISLNEVLILCKK